MLKLVVHIVNFFFFFVERLSSVPILYRPILSNLTEIVSADIITDLKLAVKLSDTVIRTTFI
jgi:hypothetical protein